MTETVQINSTSVGTSSLISFSIPDFGNGFVDISALSTLFGSSVIDSLILGNQGAAGVAWATMSAFGLLGAVKACAGAACAGWLRSAMGARSRDSDAAIGMEVACDGRGRGAMRVRYGEKGPCGLSVDASGFLKLEGEAASDRKIKWKEIYAFDKLTTRGLGGILEKKPTQLVHRNGEKTSERIDTTPAVYFYSPDPFYPHHDPWFQISVLLLSTLKIGEGMVLWSLGTGFLGIVTVIPWLYFFMVACIIEAREMIVASRPEVLDGEIDVIIGQLPNMAQSTESHERGRVVIGAPRNPRKGIWWRVAWVLGALICPTVVVFLHLSLSKESNEVVVAWLIFQALWMAGRMLVHHYAESPRKAFAVRLLYRKAWERLPDIFRKRVVNAMLALSAYIISVHPRQEWAYRDNASTYQELRRIVIGTETLSSYPLPSNTTTLKPSNTTTLKPSNTTASKPSDYNIEVHGVIGDPTLISAAWIANTPGLTFESLYDTCILRLKLPSSPGNASRYVTIPCVRFLTGISASETPPVDEETNEPLNSLPQFFPKGVTNNGSRNAWWYFIPAGHEQWLLFKQDVLSPVLRKHSAELISDQRITAILSRGNLVISLSHVNEIKSALKLSEKARCTLFDILS